MRSAPAKIIVALIAGNFAFTSFAKAQMWGSGMWGGMQGCNYNYGPASGATSESDEMRELNKMEAELLEERREVRTELRELEREKERLTSSINEGLLPTWAGVALAHMDGNRSCCLDTPPRRGEPDPEELPPPPPSKRLPKAPRPAPEPRKKLSSVDEPGEGAERAPASETVGGQDWGAPVGAPVSGGGGEGYGGAGMCYPPEYPYNNSDGKWRVACAGDGRINPSICSIPGAFQRRGVKPAEVSRCAGAISRYSKVVRDIDRLEARKAAIADELTELKRSKREAARESRMEAGCTTCAAGGRAPGRPVRDDGFSFGRLAQQLAPALLGVAVGGGLEALNYFQNKDNNSALNKLGHATMPYQFGQYMYPFASMGIYGSALSGVNGGFGCSPGIGGGGNAFGPFGMGGPFGMSPYSNMGGPFGYPMGMMPGFPMMGGGMFNPGFGPWGMNGMNPQMMAGIGFGNPMMGGNPFGGSPFGGSPFGGSPFGGSPFGGQFGGGIGGSPFGLNAGFGFGTPGMGVPGMGGYPGFGFGGSPLGGSPFGGSPFGGSPFGPGIGGVGGMSYSPMMPFGGSPMAMGGSPFGSPMGIGGSPFGSPYSMGGGFMNPYMSQYQQYQNNMIGRQVQGQQLYTKYYSLMSEINAFNSGVNYLNSPAIGIGGYGGGGGLNFGVGVNFGLGSGTSYFGGSTPWITGSPTYLSPTSTVSPIRGR